MLVCTDPPSLLSRPVKSKVIMHDLDPEWTEVLKLKLTTNDVDGLSESGHFFITIWDWDR